VSRDQDKIVVVEKSMPHQMLFTSHRYLTSVRELHHVECRYKLPKTVAAERVKREHLLFL